MRRAFDYYAEAAQVEQAVAVAEYPMYAISHNTGRTQLLNRFGHNWVLYQFLGFAGPFGRGRYLTEEPLLMEGLFVCLYLWEMLWLEELNYPLYRMIESLPGWLDNAEKSSS